MESPVKNLKDLVSSYGEGIRELPDDICDYQNPYNGANGSTYSVCKCPLCNIKHQVEEDLAILKYNKGSDNYFIMMCFLCDDK